MWALLLNDAWYLQDLMSSQTRERVHDQSRQFKSGKLK